jgi:hypothetical protein
MSNRYTVQVRLSYYADVEVEADDEHSAKQQAIRQAHRAMEKGQGCWGEEPSVTHITKEGESK